MQTGFLGPLSSVFSQQKGNIIQAETTQVSQLAFIAESFQAAEEQACTYLVNAMEVFHKNLEAFNVHAQSAKSSCEDLFARVSRLTLQISEKETVIIAEGKKCNEELDLLAQRLDQVMLQVETLSRGIDEEKNLRIKLHAEKAKMEQDQNNLVASLQSFRLAQNETNKALMHKLKAAHNVHASKSKVKESIEHQYSLLKQETKANQEALATVTADYKRHHHDFYFEYNPVHTGTPNS